MYINNKTTIIDKDNINEDECMEDKENNKIRMFWNSVTNCCSL